MTAFVTYALEGYKVNAVRYLLKDDENIEKAIMECLDTILQNCRIHKSYLVNYRYVKSVERYQAVLLNEQCIPVSKARYLDARNEFVCYQGEI